MRFFEITKPKTQPTPQTGSTTDITKEPNSVDVNPTDNQSVIDEPEVKKSRSKKPSSLPEQYADIDKTVAMAEKIDGIVKAAGLTGASQGIWSRANQPHIRILNAIPTQSHIDAIKTAGVKLTPADQLTSSISGQYAHNTYNFTVAGKIYTIVFAARGGKEGGGQIGIQQLRPNKLGLTGKDVTWTRSTLAAAVKEILPTVVKDPITAKALDQLVDVALKKRKTIDPEILKQLSGVLNEISQSFGEVLTPILMADDDSFVITFPEASNEMLIDAEVNGQPVAVKSLGGSGNSFAAIRSLIEQYAEAKKTAGDLEYDEMLDLISEFVSDKGSTNDNVIRTAQKAKIPEAVALNNLLGSAPQSFGDLLKATETLYQDIVNEVGQDKAYERYIQIILPVAKSGNWSKESKEGTPKKEPKIQVLGMPSDWRKYSGQAQKDDDEKSAKRTGKTSFDRNFTLYAARQLTYMLGVAFEKEMKVGVRAEKMGKTLNSIMANKQAVAAKIDIDSDGGLSITQTPFSSVNWRFQYHAATDTPDRNAPGFAMKFK